MVNGTNETGVDTERTGFFGGVLNFLESIANFFLSIVDWLNPLSENFILKQLFTLLGSILDYINPFSENFILSGVVEFLGNILSYINPFSENFFGYKLIDLLKNALQSLFVPSEERISALTNTVTSKFDFIDSVKIGANSLKDMFNNLGNAPKLTVDLGATKYTEAYNATIIDFSFYAPYKQYGDLVLTGFIYVMFIWRFFITLPNTINGVGSTGSIVNTFYKNGGGL